jgi:ATP-dependent Clp protease ATP-binding subunit ClpC
MSNHNLTERLHALLGDAAGEAQSLNHAYIGTEHLLLALLAAKESLGATALRNLGVDLNAATNRVRTIIHAGRPQPHASSGALLPFTSRSKKVLELAAEEARALNHPFVGTEHLLLGLVAEGKGIAAQVLFDAGVAIANARAEVLAVLGTSPAEVGHTVKAVPPNAPPTRIAVVLEYENGAMVSKHFMTTRDAIAFLENSTPHRLE